MRWNSMMNTNKTVGKTTTEGVGVTETQNMTFVLWNYKTYKSAQVYQNRHNREEYNKRKDRIKAEMIALKKELNNLLKPTLVKPTFEKYGEAVNRQRSRTGFDGEQLDMIENKDSLKVMKEKESAK